MDEKVIIWKGRDVLEKFVLIVSIAAVTFHLWHALTGAAEPFWFRSVHLTFLLPLVFLIYPTKKKGFLWLDLILSILSFLALYYVWGFDYDRMITRYVGMDPVFIQDMIMGTVLIIVLLEATRRVLGLIFTGLAVLSLLYIFLGNNIFGTNIDFSNEKIFEQLYLSINGIFGVPLGASASYIFLFVLFGALVEVSGLGKTFMNLVMSLVGHQKGGSAKISVLSSALMGSINGSPTSNVVTTGTFTIPLMQKSGYSKTQAGGIEAAASTGGQILPPIMGSVAFVMADFVGIPYIEVIKAAILPAILYFFSIFIMVHIQAEKKGLVGVADINAPSIKQTLLNNWQQFVPILILIYFLVSGFTAYYSVAFAILSVPICNMFKKHTRMGLKDLLIAMEKGTRGAVFVSLATATAGLIVGVFSLSGLALDFTKMITRLPGEFLLLSLFLTMIATIILGMGIPTTAAYITCVAVTAPALVGFGIDVFSVHMFILYFACLSSITPPVAIAAYAAAGLNGADALKTAFQACKYGIVAFIVPYIFIYSDVLFLKEDIISTVIGICTAFIGIFALVISLEGYVYRRLNFMVRIVFFALGILSIVPSILFSSIASLIIILIISIIGYRSRSNNIGSTETKIEQA